MSNNPGSVIPAQNNFSESKLQTLIDHLPALIAYLDRDCRFCFSNKVHQAWWGLSEEQIIGRTLQEVTRHQDPSFLEGYFKRALAGEAVTFENSFVYPGAGERFVQCLYCPDKNEKGEIVGVLVSVTDLTAEKKAQSDLLQKEKERRLIFDAAPASIWYKDANNIIIHANRVAADRVGLSTDEIEGKSTYDLYPEHAAKYHADDLEVIRSGQPKLGIIEPLKLLSGEVLWLRTDKIPYKDPAGETGVIVFSIDITDWVRAKEDRAKMEEELRFSQKMESLGTLAGGIAHDFNNMLLGILGYSQLSQYELPDDSPVKEHLKKIDVSALRARDLVQQILAFSQRSNKVESSQVLVSNIIEEVLSLIRATVPATIQIRAPSAATNFMTYANPGSIHQVLLNIITNAAYSMREKGGVLEVGVEAIAASDLPAGNSILHHKKKYIKISISDTGCGMSAEVQRRIFEPYFTTKRVGEGSGLGLSVVHGIVSSYDGLISVKSEVDKGTVFDIYLPMYEGVVDPEAEQPIKTEERRSGHGRILFVDDEKLLANLGSESLTSLGYQVVSCCSSKEALDLFSASPQAWDLIITDQIMPEMTGDILIRKIHEIRADIPIILCTGFAASVSEKRALEAGAVSYLSKPYSFERLSEVAAIFIARPAEKNTSQVHH